GELDADRLLPLLYRGLLPKLGSTVLGEKPPFDGWQPAADEPGLNRTPFYCSGCPHNTSTLQLPEGSQAAAGIGCHGMAIGLPHTHGITHMGGEGVQWVGAAPFTTTPHLFQNLGDGTLFHSGSLAIRQAVAAGTSITFKILYNAAVGMTGGQQADGAVGVPELTRMLQAQGVRHIIVTTDEPDKYPPGATWASGVEVWHRDRILEAQQKLKEIQGVTVLIHDQGCAAELRRMRRKGQAPDPPMRVFINEAVCEGCGDCGRKSNCLSVIPVQTDFGRKTQIHQASCNKDFSCLKGDCPAFVSVVPKKQLKKETHIPQITDELPRPNCHSGEAAQLYMVGIGGTGVVTVNQILGTAAMLEGKVVKALDQTGLSQKGGTVVAHLKIMPQEQAVSPKIAAGGADAYIAFDMLAAATHKHLKYAAPGKTIGIVSTSRIATGQMVADPRADFPEVERLSSKIDAHTRKHYNHYLDTQALSQALFRSHLPANLLQIGVAFQAGCIPLRAESIEQAIELNGVAVAQNIQAFRAGRKALLDPEWAAQLQQIRPGAMKAPPLPANAPDLPAALKSLPESVQQLIARRYADLCAYQNPAYARQYLEFVQGVQQAEATALGQHRITEAVARYLYKLMAYKDEYEVARLHLQPQAGQALQDTFGQVSRVAYWLHPPLLRALGWKKKIRFGSWIRPFFRLLYALRLLRGTALDPFGYARVRKTERQLVRDYCQMIERLMEQLDESRADTILKLAELPDLIRGYEEVKMKNVQLYERQKAEYLADLQTAVVSEQHGD
ncbi:MAG: indolepyruvate ferredoxin oxidoreductase family protein, partial [Bacteroidetes bacterium]